MSSLNVSIDRFQASLIRDGNSIDELLTEVDNLEKIEVIDYTEDDEGNPVRQIETYDSYTEVLAVAIYSDVISVELLNSSFIQELEEEE